MVAINTRSVNATNMPSWVPPALRHDSVTIFCAEFNIRRPDIGFVLGSKGFKIKRIQTQTGANITLQNRFGADAEWAVMYIESVTLQSLNRAYANLVSEAQKAHALNTGQMQKTASVPVSQYNADIITQHAGLLIGRSGATCRELKKKYGLTGLRVNTHPDPAKANAGLSQLVLAAAEQTTLPIIYEQLKARFPLTFGVTPQLPAPQSMPMGATAGGGNTEYAPGASSYYPPRNATERSVMTLYPTLFDGVDRTNAPHSPDGPRTPPPRSPDGPRTPPGTPPPHTPPESPRTTNSSSWRDVPEEQLHLECQIADRMLEFFTKNN